jgi:hypothetical protein
MAERYVKQLEFQNTVSVPDCPVALEKGAVLLDTRTNTYCLQLKFANIGKTTIDSIQICVEALNSENNPAYPEISATYHENTAVGYTFGTKNLLPVPNDNATSFRVYVVQVTTAGGYSHTYPRGQYREAIPDSNIAAVREEARQLQREEKEKQLIEEEENKKIRNKKWFKRFVLIALAAALVIGIPSIINNAVQRSRREAVVGTWEISDRRSVASQLYQLTFNSNGRFVDNTGTTGTYRVSGNTVTLSNYYIIDIYRGTPISDGALQFNLSGNQLISTNVPSMTLRYIRVTPIIEEASRQNTSGGNVPAMNDNDIDFDAAMTEDIDYFINESDDIWEYYLATLQHYIDTYGVFDGDIQKEQSGVQYAELIDFENNGKPMMLIFIAYYEKNEDYSIGISRSLNIFTPITSFCCCSTSLRFNHMFNSGATRIGVDFRDDYDTVLAVSRDGIKYLFNDGNSVGSQFKMFENGYVRDIIDTATTATNTIPTEENGRTVNLFKLYVNGQEATSEEFGNELHKQLDIVEKRSFPVDSSETVWNLLAFLQDDAPFPETPPPTSIIIGDFEYRIDPDTNERAILRYLGNASHVVIPDGVVSIGSQAFYNNTNIESIEIPDSVSTIGARAFQNTSITSITVSASVTQIGQGAFWTAGNIIPIYGYSGSEAERYANLFWYPFIALDDNIQDEHLTVTDAANDIVGIWELSHFLDYDFRGTSSEDDIHTIEFKEDSTWTLTDYFKTQSGTYTIDNTTFPDGLVVRFIANDGEEDYDISIFHYTIDNGMLILKSVFWDGMWELGDVAMAYKRIG